MGFYEVVYETGEVSVADYADDAEALSALGEQNRRAVSGEQAGPQGGPASRIAKVFKYNEHPGSLNEDGTLTAEVLNTELTDLVKQYTDKNGVVNVLAFAEGVTGLVHPMNLGDVAPHDSKYKMTPTGELDLKTLKAGN
jgi:hypothetical protein